MGILCFIILRKVKNTTQMQKKSFVQFVVKVLWLIEHVESGLWSFLVLLTFWPNDSLLWGCLMHWKVFSSTLGLFPLEFNNGRQGQAQNIHTIKVIGENDKYVFYFTENHRDIFGQLNILPMNYSSSYIPCLALKGKGWSEQNRFYFVSYVYFL